MYVQLYNASGDPPPYSKLLYYVFVHLVPTYVYVSLFSTNVYICILSFTSHVCSSPIHTHIQSCRLHGHLQDYLTNWTSDYQLLLHFFWPTSLNTFFCSVHAIVCDVTNAHSINCSSCQTYCPRVLTLSRVVFATCPSGVPCRWPNFVPQFLSFSTI